MGMPVTISIEFLILDTLKLYLIKAKSAKLTRQRRVREAPLGEGTNPARHVMLATSSALMTPNAVTSASSTDRGGQRALRGRQV